MATLKSHAKINLFLHVTGKLPSGYHTLDSMVVFAQDIFDVINITESSTNSIEILGPHANKLHGTNILETVLEKFNKITSIPKLKISIEKNIPVGAGLGGGSSNASSVIKFLIKNYYPHLQERNLINFCKSIGADVMPCFYSRAIYFNGIGEIISPIKDMPPIYAIIVYPNIVTNTQDIFSKKFKNIRDNIYHIYKFKHYSQLCHYLESTENSLYANTNSKSELSNIIKNLKHLDGCGIARMTGSGSACFGLFERKQIALAGAKALQKKFPEYSIYTTKLN